MKIVHFALTAAILALPMLATSAPAQAATANQYSAAGHGRRPMMTNRPSRAIYHHRAHRRHRGY